MKIWTTAVIGLGILSGGAWLLATLHGENAHLRLQIAHLRLRTAELHGALERERHDAAEAQRAASAVANTRAAEITRAKAEVAMLEKRAKDLSSAQLASPTSQNTDPEKGMTPVENLRNVGRATPAAAFQTVAWAGYHGDYQTLAGTIVIDPDARIAADALLANLSPAAREKYPTPESLMALIFAKAFVTLSGIQIVNTDYTDAGNAVLTVRGLMATDEPVAMRLGPTGWQMWEGVGSIAWFRSQLANTTP